MVYESATYNKPFFTVHQIFIYPFKRVYERVYENNKPFHIPFKRVYERVFDSHIPLKGYMKVQRIINPLRVYEIQIPFHIPL